MFCKKCGNEVKDFMKFCTTCGTPVPEEEAVVPPVQEAVPEAEEPVAEAQTTEEPVVEVPIAEEPRPVEEPVVEDTAPEVTAEEPVAVPVAEPVQKPKKKKKGKGVLITVIVVLLVAALGVGGWFGYNWWQDSKDYEEAVSLLEKKEYDKALEQFKGLEDFKDSADQAKKLEGWQTDYDAAKKLMDEGKFSDAQKAFAALEDYRDSKELAQYAEAKAAFAAAEDGEAYVAAAELFAAMGEYEDCAAMVSKCYLEAAYKAVEAGDEDAVEAYLEKMSEEDRTTFEDSYHDEEVLAGWEEALQARYEMEMTDDYAWDFSEELEILEQYAQMTCKDKALEELLKNYIELVEEQQDNLDEDGSIIDWLVFYELELERSELLNQMNDEYDFLEDNDELYDWYIDMEEYFEQCVEIERSMSVWYEEVEIQEDDRGYYVEYTNDTDYDFTLNMGFFYYDDQGELITEDHQMGSLRSGETLRFYMEIPENMDTWNAGFYYTEYQELDMETGT